MKRYTDGMGAVVCFAPVVCLVVVDMLESLVLTVKLHSGWRKCIIDDVRGRKR